MSAVSVIPMTDSGREEPVALTDRSRSANREIMVVGLPLLEVQRSVASQNDEWPVPAAAVSGLQNLTGCSQLQTALHVNKPTRFSFLQRVGLPSVSRDTSNDMMCPGDKRHGRK